jgi:hypothetical protein
MPLLPRPFWSKSRRGSSGESTHSNTRGLGHAGGSGVTRLPVSSDCHPTEQGVPLRLKLVGALVLPVWLALKPKVVVPPLAVMVAL